LFPSTNEQAYCKAIANPININDVIIVLNDKTLFIEIFLLLFELFEELLCEVSSGDIDEGR
jgi:hypothetical protein